MQNYGNRISLAEFSRIVSATLRLASAKKETLPIPPRGFSQMLLKVHQTHQCLSVFGGRYTHIRTLYH
eukprot:4911518-Pyramimonas_sp.AAC.1